MADIEDESGTEIEDESGTAIEDEHISGSYSGEITPAGVPSRHFAGARSVEADL